MDILSLLSQANSEANQWLNENPLILGLLILAIGSALLFFGIFGLKRGEIRDKWGIRLTGSMARFSSIVRIFAGSAAMLFGLYKIISGAFS